MTPEENPYNYVTDQDTLLPEEREKYFDFWASRTLNERLAEVYRLNRLKWGDEVFERGMDKTKIEVINMVTGEKRIIYNKVGK